MRVLTASLILGCATMVLVTTRSATTNGSSTVTDQQQTPPKRLICRQINDSAKGQYAGLIKSIGNNCYRQIGDASPVLLDPKKDKLAKVNVGEMYQCFTGTMMFELSGSTKTQGATFSIASDDGCQVIRAPSIPRTDGSGRGIKVSGTARAGPVRGDSGPFCSPANQSRVAADKIVIRWSAAAVGSTLSLTIHGANRPFWFADDIKGELGQLVSDDLRMRLREYRDKGETGPFTLVLEDSKGQKNSIVFSLLTKVEEQTLAKELDDCEQSTREEMLSLCRIASFKSRKMYSEVATEYDVALRFAPDSEELNARAAEAFRAISDAPCRPVPVSAKRE